MSNSHKISLLDLQTPDLSSYGKNKLDSNPGPSRSSESSYHQQLSESLSKKQPGSTSDRTQESDSSSKSVQADRDHSGTRSFSSRSTTEHREDQTLQGKSNREETVGTSQELQNSNPESKTTDASQAPGLEEQTDSIETIQADVSPQSEVKQSDREQGQLYSLFNSSVTEQNEGQFEQVVITESSEIQPPPNFQLVEDQNVVNLSSDVTETTSYEVLPIPEGLAGILNQQDFDASQMDASQQTQANENHLLNTDSEINEAPQSSIGIEKLSREVESILPIEERPPVQDTEELQQAIQKFNEQNSDDFSDSENENQPVVHSDLQQRFIRSGNHEQADSTDDEINHGKIPLDSEVVSQTSEAVIEQVQQVKVPEQTEIVEKSHTKTERVDQKTEEVSFNPGLHTQRSVSETQNQNQIETTKLSPLTQENSSATDSGQTVAQPTGLNPSSSTTGAQEAVSLKAPLDASQVEQLVERIVGSVRQSQSTGQQLKIRLSPPELGTLQIEVSLKNGQYTAKLEVQNNQTQKVINDNIAQLREALAKSGVAIDRIDVHINTDSSEDQRSSQSDARSQFGSDFDSNQFSENSGDTDNRQNENGFVEESVQQRDDSDQAEQDRPQIIRSQGMATDNVDEIDVQI